MAIEYVIKNEYPPEHIYKKCVEMFGADFESGVVFTYGKTIYSKRDISKDLLEHELTHVVRQLEIGEDKWWSLYFESPAFRLAEELEAYRKQYLFIIKNYPKDKHRSGLETIATLLSSELYGNLVSKEQVKYLIQNNL